ncbi:hypothetical protein MAR_027264 [Mya arenaria]|uniref:Uncharacterized protein n=1 Tax=Mya arenaria TaxID=6604 RepID=A0ABY7EXC9_MYAAR|nr:hypothetical protein MAR_027264 [Mya arenaria]
MTNYKRNVSSKDNKIKQLKSRSCRSNSVLNIPLNYNVRYEAGRRDLKSLQPENDLFLPICQRRHVFRIKDLSVRFGLELFTCSISDKALTELSVFYDVLKIKYGWLNASIRYLTNEIAKHRVHIELSISKVKTYKMFSHRIPTSLFQT